MASSKGQAKAGVTRIGVAGWDYADWNGVVYPVWAGEGFDRLRYIADHVDVVEINSTFYRPASPATASSWLRRIEHRPTFTFTAKAHRSWTHEKNADLRSEIPATLGGLAPLLEAGRLGALLLQFPHTFRFDADATERLERLLEPLAAWPVVVEVRHASWEADEAAQWFLSRSVGWCAVDQPRVTADLSRALPRVTSSVGYLRLHGRNAENWLRSGAGRDARYNYLYAESELEGLCRLARRMERSTEQLYVIQNNHFRGKALVNALQMKRLLQGEQPLAPERLVMSYPELKPHVRLARPGLF
jgi:uncharacterized protein YecE (DUF72 family)